MEVKVISQESLLEDRRKATVEKDVPFNLFGKAHTVKKKIANGEMEVIRLEKGKAVGELMTTSAGSLALVQKTVLDIEQGRENVQLLYPSLYRRVESRQMTRDVRVPGAAGRARVVFLEHIEGEEVKFGTRTIGAEETVPVLTYAAGMEWTEDMEEFDLNWEAEEANRALGQAYNALLNHLHLYPIINHTYSGANLTAYDTTGADEYQKDRKTIQNAIRDAALDTASVPGGRRPTIGLIHPSNQFRIADALQERQIGGTILPAVGQQITSIILYGGWRQTVGLKEYEYAGAPTNAGFLVEPRRFLVELVKHDLLVDAGNPDMSRLIKEQIIARARRGVYCAPTKSVQKFMLE